MSLRSWTVSLLLAFLSCNLRAATNLTVATGGPDPVSSASFAVSGDKTISPTNLAAALGSGSVDLQANADTLFSDSVTASVGGNLVVQSGRSISLAANVALSLPGTFLATAHDPSAISPPAGTASFTMDSGSSISAPNGISIGNSNGVLSLAGLTASAGTIRLTAGGNITQSAAFAASALGIRSTSGSVTLNNSGNNVATFAAAVTGNLTYSNSGSLVIGSVGALSQGNFSFGSTSGITAANATVTSGGDITINSGISATNNLSLSTAGSVTQSAAISAAGLELLGTGSYTLANASNHTSTLAASTTGNVTYVDSGAFNVGTVNSTSGITAGNVNLQSGGALGINGAINAGTNTVRLVAGGNITQSAFLSASSLGVRTSGSVTLNNSGNSVATFAAAVTDNLTYSNSGSLVIGSVGALSQGNFSFGSTSGITAANATVISGGDITISSGISATTNLSLSTAGSVTQSAAISAAGLELLGTGSYALANASNHTSTLAASTTGNVTYVDSGAFNVGTVNSTSGITAGNVNLQSGGALGINGAINATTNTVRLVSPGDITQTAGITASALGIRGTSLAPANYSLTNSGNNVGTIAAAVTGNFAYASSGVVNIGAVGAVSQGNFNFNSTSGITTTNGFASLSSAGNVTQSAAVNAGTGLELTGTGSYTLTNPSNHTSTLAANTTGNLSYTDSGSFAVGTVNNTIGINAANATFSASNIALSTAAHITAGSITFLAGTNLSLAVSGPIASAVINGATMFGQGIAFTLTTTNGYDPTAGDTFQLVNGTISGTTPSWVLPTLDAGLTWDTSQFASTGEIAVVPEPSPVSLTLYSAILGGIFVTMHRRRRAGKV